MMISKFIIPVLLLLVKLMECHDGEDCSFAPVRLINQTLHYLLGDKIKLTAWCTSTKYHIGDKHGKYFTRRTRYSFYEHKGDKDRGFTLGFTEHLSSKPSPKGVPMYNATTILIIDPAIMLYDNERITFKFMSKYPTTWHKVLTWLDLHIVQLKKESRPVHVPDTCPNVTLYCEMEYPVAPQHDRARKWTWLKFENGNEIPLLNSEKYEIGDDGSLIINHLLWEDHGIYECSVHYVEDTKEVTAQRISSSVRLTVTKTGGEEPDVKKMPGCDQKPPPFIEEKLAPIPDDSVEIEYFDMSLIGLLILGTIFVTIGVVLRATRPAKVTLEFL